MWLSGRRSARNGAGAMVGQATVAGDPAGAYLDGERRTLSVFGPGGYHWRPALGQEVLVLKGEGEPSCVAGARCGGELEPGEILITAGAASIRLGRDGDIALTGRVTVNGVPIEDLAGGGE